MLARSLSIKSSTHTERLAHDVLLMRGTRQSYRPTLFIDVTDTDSVQSQNSQYSDEFQTSISDKVDNK